MGPGNQQDYGHPTDYREELTSRSCTVQVRWFGVNFFQFWLNFCSNRQLVGALNNLKSKTLKSSDILPKLKEKEAARDAALVNYINASKNMEKRIERDQNLLQEDNPSVDTYGNLFIFNVDVFFFYLTCVCFFRTLALFRRKLLRLQYLRVLIMGLVSHGNLDYVKNPEYILMMKRYKKKLTTELIVDAVRVFSDDDDQMSSSISAAEQWFRLGCFNIASQIHFWTQSLGGAITYITNYY